MIKTNVYDSSGKVTGKISLPEKVFAAKENPILMAQAVRVYLSNQRKARAKAKTRGEVNLTKAKWFRQKGTGRARHGARSAPIFRGGGVAHGPTGQQNWGKSLPEKMRKQALVSALTSKLKGNQIIVVKGLEKLEGKTKEMSKMLEALLGKKKAQTKKILMVLPGKMDNVLRAGRNIPGLKIQPVSSLNTYEVLNGGTIFLSQETIDYFKKSL